MIPIISYQITIFEQLFRVEHRRFLITVGGDRTTGKCLDVAGGSGALHSQIQLFRCHGEENQQFELHQDGTIRSMGKCLDIPDSRAYDHQGVQLFYCRAGQENQRFIIDHENRIHVMGKCFDVPNGEIVNNNLLQLFQCRNQNEDEYKKGVLKKKVRVQGDLHICTRWDDKPDTISNYLCF